MQLTLPFDAAQSAVKIAPPLHAAAGFQEAGHRQRAAGRAILTGGHPGETRGILSRRPRGPDQLQGRRDEGPASGILLRARPGQQRAGPFFQSGAGRSGQPLKASRHGLVAGGKVQDQFAQHPAPGRVSGPGFRTTGGQFSGQTGLPPGQIGHE